MHLSKLNKKAFLAEGFLPLVAIAISIFTLLAFLYYNHSTTTFSADTAELISQTENSQRYIERQAKEIANQTIQTCKGCDVDGLAAVMLDVARDREKIYSNEKAGNLYGKIRNGEFILIEEPDGTYRLEIPIKGGDPITTQIKVRDNQITRSVFICMRLNSTGEFLHDC